ncbi:hypothetical protein LP422_17165 [Janibacter limosus]|uniref:Uncharacterized protein n=1 Tax=Janibacter limosus TaxID=53458 RepID=A0AC61U2I8_9MICO|nr:hypothetical protein [Janibacter limosus]UUZ44230.1 hypothetical protein LP422_17165 [Janibacter limosus]
MNPLIIAKTMAKRGMLNPGPPVARVKQLTALKKWGFGLAGELRQGRQPLPGDGRRHRRDPRRDDLCAAARQLREDRRHPAGDGLRSR